LTYFTHILFLLLDIQEDLFTKIGTINPSPNKRLGQIFGLKEI